ncbi:AMP-dependent synthetase/ligase [Sulfurovum sp. ST-21]|uniref:AMP-binding protein n=1 Tax=Sulfurovum indicum TaxID=2779528 RepID=A0A7M1S8T5_9BACT|nr:AMP-binding protein [Sulfurovum indicum]QOR62740.1 AMP-binding protein [Sulfurovum indicum]
MKDQFTHFGELYRYLELQPPKEAFLHYRVEGVYKNISKSEFLQTVRYLALAFYQNGWKGKQIGIAVSPSPYWLMLDYALMLSGAVSVPIFTNISSKNLHFQIMNADLGTVFIENREQEELISRAGKDVVSVYLEDIPNHKVFSGYVEEGRKIDAQNPSVFKTLIYQISPLDLATIVYTSGTSGTPKGVELTHRNLISQIHSTAQNYRFDRDSDLAFSLLPLAHIFERMVMHFYLSRELSIYFADDVKNVGILLKEVNPTVMTVVPRLLEKVFFKMRTKALEGSFLKKWLVHLAFYRATTKDPYGDLTLFDKLLDRIVYHKLRQAFGTRMRMMISGGAALSDKLYRFYLNIGIPLYQGYGLTESSPVICSNTPDNNKIGTCGKAFPGVKVKVTPEGELLACGPNIMRGYHNNKKATDEAIDEEGWLHTGDLASIDEDGYVRITGRRDELFKTSTGEFISSVYIEQALTGNGWFEHALVVGEAKPYVVALLFIEHDFLERLAVQMQTAPSMILESQKFETMVRNFIGSVNKKLNHWEKIRDYRVISDRLSIEEGHITPSMKLGKKHLMDLYHKEIGEMYKGHL